MTKLLLYAQPLEAQPYVSKSALKDGSVKEAGSSWGAIAFTDAGKAAWEAVNDIWPEANVDPVDLPFGASPWAVRIITSAFRLMLSRKHYKSLEGALGSYLTLDIDGDKHAISRFLRQFLRNLGRAPWEMAFPPEFKERTGLETDDLADDWEKFAKRVAAVREGASRDEFPEAGRKKAGPGGAMDGGKKKTGAVPERITSPVPVLSVTAKSFLAFDGDRLVMNVKVTNASSISVEKVTVTPRAPAEMLGDGAPKMISYLKPSESLTLQFPLGPVPETGGEVSAEIDASGNGKKLSLKSDIRNLKQALPEIRAVDISLQNWNAAVSSQIRRDEAKPRVPIAAADAFDRAVGALKTTGLYLLEPELVRGGASYQGRARLYGEDAKASKYAVYLECIGDFTECKFNLRYYAESAELVLALREMIVAALAGRK